MIINHFETRGIPMSVSTSSLIFPVLFFEFQTFTNSKFKFMRDKYKKLKNNKLIMLLSYLGKSLIVKDE